MNAVEPIHVNQRARQTRGILRPALPRTVPRSSPRARCLLFALQIFTLCLIATFFGRPVSAAQGEGGPLRVLSSAQSGMMPPTAPRALADALYRG